MTEESNLGFDDPFDGFDPTPIDSGLEFPTDGGPFPEPEPLPWPEPDPTPESDPWLTTDPEPYPAHFEPGHLHDIHTNIAGGVGSNNSGWPCPCTGLYL